VLKESSVVTPPKWVRLASTLTRAIETHGLGVSSALVRILDEHDPDCERLPIAWHVPTTADIVINPAKIPGMELILGTSFERDSSPYSGLMLLAPAPGTVERAVLTLAGVLTHEGAHSRYSTFLHDEWFTDLQDERIDAAKAVMLLEELRVERAAVDRSSTARRALRNSASALVIPSPESLDRAVGRDEDGTPVAVNVLELLEVAALVLGRRDSGVLNHYETDPIEEFMEDIMPTGLLDRATDIWCSFFDLGARVNPERMTELGHEWADLCKEFEPEKMLGLPGLIRMLMDMLGEAGELTEKWAGTKADRAPDELAGAEALERATDITDPKDREDGKEASHGFGPGRGRRRARYRNPHPVERATATKFAKVLEKLHYNERAVTTRRDVAPPGRLNARAAVARAADKAQGRASTAAPWQRKIRRHTEHPPLVVGTMTDISGSMGWAEDFVASVTWIINRAVRHVNGSSAAVTFGDVAEIVLRPSSKNSRVVTRDADGGSEAFNNALGALDTMLHLTDPRRGARILFVVTDGYLVNDGEMAAAAKWVKKLNDSGCTVIFIDNGTPSTYGGHPTVPKGARFVRVSGTNLDKDFNAIATEISKVAR
jgi:hypothetical protein